MRQEIEEAFESRAEALIDGLNFIVGDAVGNEALAFRVVGTATTDPGAVPDGLPTAGLLVTHKGTLKADPDDAFAIGWFFDEPMRKVFAEAKGGDDGLSDGLRQCIEELQEHVRTDKYDLEGSKLQLSDDLMADYLGGDLPPELGWAHYQINGMEGGSHDVFLAYPVRVLQRVFELIDPASAEETTPEDAAADSHGPAENDAFQLPEPPDEDVLRPPVRPAISPRLSRILRTEVPVVVTLAQQKMQTSKLLDMGPGRVIEFERQYDQPLVVSVNNLPIAVGEAVKIGDHFGLKISRIVSVEDRIEELGEKWQY